MPVSQKELHATDFRLQVWFVDRVLACRMLWRSSLSTTKPKTYKPTTSKSREKKAKKVLRWREPGRGFLMT